MVSRITDMMNRREFLKGTVTAGLYPLYSSCRPAARWESDVYRRPKNSRVAILQARGYDFSLKETVLKGLDLFRLDVRGKTVVLKPNLVEFDPNGVINTHPAVVAAATESFLSLGARQVIVAEGPGHRRDNEYLLTASGLFAVLKEHGASYVDLNYDDVRPIKLRSSFTNLGQLYLPETLLKADLLVSMPKLKTHHWAGVTLSLKNMFGVIPGSIYGWPKNVLHWAGIDRSVLDINASLAMPRFAIVDGVVGMEGNGPIQGRPRFVGALVMGDDFVAVDATATRLMGVDPDSVAYLAEAGRFLGNLSPRAIDHVGEPLERFAQRF